MGRVQHDPASPVGLLEPRPRKLGRLVDRGFRTAPRRFRCGFSLGGAVTTHGLLLRARRAAAWCNRPSDRLGLHSWSHGYSGADGDCPGMRGKDDTAGRSDVSAEAGAAADSQSAQCKAATARGAMLVLAPKRDPLLRSKSAALPAAHTGAARTTAGASGQAAVCPGGVASMTEGSTFRAWPRRSGWARKVSTSCSEPPMHLQSSSHRLETSQE